MKQTDIDNAVRILRIVNQLTAEECSSVEFANDNPDWNGMPDCCVTVHRLGDGLEMLDRDFRADSVLECLLLALQHFGITEDPGETSSIRCEDCGIGILSGHRFCEPCGRKRLDGVIVTNWNGPVDPVQQVKDAIDRAKSDVGFRYEPQNPIAQQRFEQLQAEYFLDPDGDDGS